MLCKRKYCSRHEFVFLYSFQKYFNYPTGILVRFNMLILKRHHSSIYAHTVANNFLAVV